MKILFHIILGILFINPSFGADIDICFNQLMQAYNSLGYSRNNHESFILGYVALNQECQELLNQNEQFQGILSREEHRIREEIGSGIYQDPSGLSGFFQIVMKRPLPDDILESNNRLVESRQSSCSDKDFRSKLPPIRSQGDVGWCYAYAAADLASYETGENISAVDLALQYNQFQNERALRRGVRDTINYSSEEGLNLNFQALLDSFGSVEGTTVTNQDCKEGQDQCLNDSGEEEVTFLLGQRNGFCPESNAPSDSYEGRAISEILYGMKELDQYIQENRGNQENLALAQGICGGSFGEIIQQAFPSTLIEDVVDILEHPEMINSYQQLVNKACQGNRISTQGTLNLITQENAGGVKNYREKINAALENDEILMIAYSSKILSPYLNEDHASTIVGRRWNPSSQSCQYLVRNSHGSNCNGYHSTVDCEEGNLWINEEIIIKHTYQATFLE